MSNIKIIPKSVRKPRHIAPEGLVVGRTYRAVGDSSPDRILLATDERQVVSLSSGVAFPSTHFGAYREVDCTLTEED